MSRKSDADNRANQLNPHHDAYHSSRASVADDDGGAVRRRINAVWMPPPDYGAVQSGPPKLVREEKTFELLAPVVVDYRPFGTAFDPPKNDAPPETPAVDL
jgi:hypothetical protein